jgi:hypothetical protein
MFCFCRLFIPNTGVGSYQSYWYGGEDADQDGDGKEDFYGAEDFYGGRTGPLEKFYLFIYFLFTSVRF